MAPTMVKELPKSLLHSVCGETLSPVAIHLPSDLPCILCTQLHTTDPKPTGGLGGRLILLPAAPAEQCEET
jgi:hypothetical protein